MTSLRLWACTIDRIDIGQSDALEMEQIYVKTKAIRRGNVKLASLMKKETRKEKKFTAWFKM